MHLGSIYLIVNDFEKSIRFYEELLQIPVTKQNMNRFAMFNFEGNCISLLNGHFDTDNHDEVVHKGNYSEYFDDLKSIALLPNSRKSVLNFWTEDLREEYDRVKDACITDKLTSIKYVFNVSPYYYFQLTDPDGNIIEVTGSYTPTDGEFDI